jgi:hypothetical protein
MTLSGCDELDLPPGYTQNAKAELTEEQLQQRAESLQAARAALDTAELRLSGHWGGSGYGPIYVVHFTEQEVAGFIRAKLENAGLTFDGEASNYSVDVEYFVEHWMGYDLRNIELNLFDEEKRVGVVFSTRGNERVIHEAFEQDENITAAVFHNPNVRLFGGTDWKNRRIVDMWLELNPEGERWGREIWDWWSEYGNDEALEEEYQTYIAERIAEAETSARTTLIENLTTQVQRFINRLQTEGVL